VIVTMTQLRRNGSRRGTCRRTPTDRDDERRQSHVNIRDIIIISSSSSSSTVLVLMMSVHQHLQHRYVTHTHTSGFEKEGGAEIELRDNDSNFKYLETKLEVLLIK